MIIWTGKGFLVAVIGFGCLLAMEYTVELFWDDEEYFQTHGWPIFLAFVVAAAIISIVAWVLSKEGSRTLVDPETNEEVVINADHSFFFIPLRYWGPLLVAIGFVMMFASNK